MYTLDANLGTLFPDWNPFDPVGRLLSSVGLTDEEVRGYETPFDRFRHQEAGEPLELPEDIRTSDGWFDLLFREVVPVGPSMGEDLVKEYGRKNDGFVRQVNLDNIGKDFLALIYYRQRVLDLFREGGLGLVVRSLFKARRDAPLQYTNLNNSLLPVEALTDFLTLRGAVFPRRRDDRSGSDKVMTIISDPPTRHLTLGEIPSFSSMLRDSTSLSRYIRILSVCLQDGGRWENLIRVPFADFDLDGKMTLFRDRRSSGWTRDFAIDTAMSREFCLWDIYRDDRLPSIRQISDGLGIPYTELLRILLFGETNRDRGTIHRFSGLEFLRDGFPDRVAQIFVRDIVALSPERLLTNEPKPDIL